jgi:hypothetical protein
MTMADIVKFKAIVKPTPTLFANPWHLDRSTTDDHGVPVKVDYECFFVYSTGEWTLYITVPGSRPPYTMDLKDGDELDIRSRDGTERDKGTVVMKTTTNPMTGQKSYTYTSDMTALTGIVP